MFLFFDDVISSFSANVGRSNHAKDSAGVIKDPLTRRLGSTSFSRNHSRDFWSALDRGPVSRLKFGIIFLAFGEALLP